MQVLSKNQPTKNNFFLLGTFNYDMKQSNFFSNFFLIPLTLTVFILVSGCFTTAKLPADTPAIDVLSKYYELGVPSLDKSWTPDEYVQTMKILLEQNEQKTLELPSKKNNALKITDKITDYNDYWFFESTEITDDEKLLISLDFIEPVKDLMLVYYSFEYENDGQKLKYGYEISNYQKAILKILDEQLEQFDIFLENHPELSDGQKEGEAQVKRGLTTVISGMFTVIKDEYINFKNDDICALSEVFFEFYNKNRNRIDDDSKKEFDNLTKKLNTESPLECVRKAAVLK